MPEKDPNAGYLNATVLAQPKPDHSSDGVER
jgi:hypothetical protein